VLLSFRLENHRSIREEQAFSMEPGRVDDGSSAIREEDGDSVLPVAAIYGANASGKSNLLSGFAFMQNAVADSHRFYAPEGGVPRTSFAWGEKSREPSFFEVTFRDAGIRYQYGFVANNDRFLEEWLYAYPSSRKQIWFERDEDTFKFGEHLKGENRIAEKVTRPNSLFLSAAAQNHHEQLMPIYRWFGLASVVGVNARGASAMASALKNWARGVEDAGQSLLGRIRRGAADALQAHGDELRRLLRSADFGIVDLRVANDHERGVGLSGVMVKHKSESEDAWLPLEEESNGTRQVFSLAPLLLDALAHGSLLLIDELEASLHPLLALQLVKTFNDPAQNPRNAQLVFTTHDTNFLGTTTDDPPLRRDQVWLTEKDDTGGTRLYPLTDYKPRKAENLERGYLQGRYGAIPFLGPLVDPERGER
jgi:uncharacterized protein